MCTCEEALILMNRAIDNCISEEDRAMLQAHLSECAQCRSIYEAYQQLQAGMLDLTAEVPEQFTKGLMYRISAEGKGRKHRLPFGRASALCAAAALLLLLVGSGVLKQLGGMSGASTASADCAVPENAAVSGSTGGTAKESASDMTGSGYLYAGGSEAEDDTDSGAYFWALGDETSLEEEQAPAAQSEDAGMQYFERNESDSVDGLTAPVENGSGLPDLAAYACVVYLTPGEAQLLSELQAEPELEGLAACAGGYFCEVTLEQAAQLAERYAESCGVEQVWNDEDAAQDAPALIVILEQTNQD